MARQRNRLRAECDDWKILWDFIAEKKRQESLSPSRRGPGTPSEIAAELVAKEKNMSADNVERIYKKSATTRKK